MIKIKVDKCKMESLDDYSMFEESDLETYGCCGTAIFHEHDDDHSIDTGNSIETLADYIRHRIGFLREDMLYVNLSVDNQKVFVEAYKKLAEKYNPEAVTIKYFKSADGYRDLVAFLIHTPLLWQQELS